MQFEENPTEAADILRKAVPLMVQKKIPTSPANFSLWYAYVTNQDDMLTRALDEHFSEPGRYDPELSNQLFFEHFIKRHIPDTDDTQAALLAMLGDLFETVNRTVEGTQNYGQAVSSAIADIKASDNLESIQATLQSLLEETEQASKLATNFQDELDSARQEMEEIQEQLEAGQTKHLDKLTGIGNQRYFQQQLRDTQKEYHKPNSLVVLELDHFDRFAATYGQGMADQVLVAVAKLLTKSANASTYIARTGGDRFAVILKGRTLVAARKLAEQLRQAILAMKIRQKHSSEIIEAMTASFGIATFLADESLKELIERADTALAIAQRSGHNQIVTDADKIMDEN